MRAYGSGEVPRTTVVPDPEATAQADLRQQLERAVDAASPRSEDERAWTLTRLASALRLAGELDRAAALLETAAGLDASDWTRRALATCAVAVHCDRDEPELAVQVGEEQMGRSFDERLLHVMTRAYCEAFETTGRGEYCEQWRRISAFLEEGRLPVSSTRQPPAS